MAGDTSPEATTIKVEVEDRGNKIESVDGTSVFETKTALLVSDCGRQRLPTQSFGAITVGTTAGALSKLLGTEVTVSRGFQFKAASGNSGTIVIGGSSVAYNASAASINGMPLEAGNTIFLEVTQWSSLYADASASSQVLHWIGY